MFCVRPVEGKLRWLCLFIGLGSLLYLRIHGDPERLRIHDTMGFDYYVRAIAFYSQSVM